MVLCISLQFFINDCSAATVKPMKNITVTTGQDVILRCEFSNGGLSRSWSYDSSRSPVVIYAKAVKILQDPNISLLVNDPREYSIKIKSVTAKNQGMYTCSLYDDNYQTSSMYLTVNVPPRMVKVSKDLTVDEGSRVKLQCMAEGRPKPKIYWRHVIPSADGNRATSDTLPLGKVTRGSAGNYECTADNGVSSPVTRSIELVVRYPPQVEENILKTIKVIPNQDGLLECVAVGVPKPVFTWQGPSGQSIDIGSANGRYNLVKLNQRNIVQSKLFIEKMQISDFGNWTCLARNALGSDEQVILVNKKIVPPTRLPPSEVFAQGKTGFQQANFGDNASEGIHQHSCLIILHTVLLIIFSCAS
uniref:Neurotrimin-like n=1 Tax=Phallusia mammillata TaxID=59560 RepID=A0A6F9DN95_9ASCI|nr:neurotrimin-like [Phallusia mammillata]